MNINNLLKQAQKIQKINEEFTKKEFIGNAQNGLVKVVVNGDFKLKDIEIASELLNKENKEILQELIIVALNQAYQEIDNNSKNQIKELGLPF